MTDELVVPALQLGNPIQIFIQMKVNDFSHHPGQFWLHGFHGDSLRP
jgi:hypothetical protein